MFTHSDAAFNKCHPVRQWSGSSSASQPRQATTRCWKAYRGKLEAGSAKRSARGGTVIAAATLLVPALLFSQQTGQPVVPQHPEVVNLTLKGVQVMKKTDLVQSIYTTASHCNSFLLKPFCLISKSKYFYTKKYLDHKELERDVLRIRIFYWKRGHRRTEVDPAVVPRGPNKVGVTFVINEGPPILVSNVVVNQATPLLSQREINRS